jgi:hypothetical protein
MPKVSPFMASTILLAGLYFAQSSASPSRPSTTPDASTGASAQVNKIPAGTVIPAELSKTVDAKKAKQGDKIEAKVAQDLLSNGQVVIPRGSKITGHVSAAKPHDKSDPASSLAIAFDQIEIKDKGQMPFQASIQAMAKPVNMVNPAMDASGGAPDAPGASSPGSSSAPVGGMNHPGMSSPASAPSPASPPSDAQAGSQAAQSGASLSAGSQGVIGMEGLTMNADSSQGTVISSADKNVKLESGTQLMLKVR